MLDLIFTAYDANKIDDEKPLHRFTRPVNLKFLFGFDLLKDKGIEKDSRQIQTEKVIYVFLKQ